MIDDGMSDLYSDQMNGESSAAHGSTASAPKEIKFNIHHKYTTQNLTISDRSTIGTFLSILLLLLYFTCLVHFRAPIVHQIFAFLSLQANNILTSNFR